MDVIRESREEMSGESRNRETMFVNLLIKVFQIVLFSLWQESGEVEERDPNCSMWESLICSLRRCQELLERGFSLFLGAIVDAKRQHNLLNLLDLSGDDSLSDDLFGVSKSGSRIALYLEAIVGKWRDSSHVRISQHQPFTVYTQAPIS